MPRHTARAIRRRVRGTCPIFYRVDDDQVSILRVLHGARDHDALS